ncbi:ABC transporter substrate-binding protein [Microbacterium sp. 13-71-7]|jgi:iron complex transport system substrate-binding protein|uniref:siderophore ABC transporter substrate-binding protein n=1 Tax=Microbacterium sp. 13-71-7 TaxID=1970399 RepID=UPI000BD94F6E|nr:ABC transporter substrate-binding protein [Microbacterium sp. 13-71-7]OZB86002.1 MAG: iron ABC transporter substrate-binding protein [Microbacterium sp. 13-71-7]
MSVPRILTATALGLAAAVALAGCASGPAAAPTESAKASTVTIEDNNGEHTISTPPASVVATDNRTFQTLADWGIPVKAAAVSLMPETVSYVKDKSIIDLGTHMEPDLESVVAVAPDLIVNGQRFTQHHDKLAALVPDATILELDPRDGKPFDAELKRQVTVLGEVFGKQKEAKKLVADFEAAVDRAKKAYDGSGVMAVTTSGGKIGYLAPKVGRTLGPVFDMLGLTPALTVEGADDNHKGDDISVEAIAASNPSWILVMDRDAVFAKDDASYVQAADILEKNQALASVTAIQQKRVVYMPTDTYLNEGIQTYTTFLNSFADALEKSAKKS